MGKRLSKIKEQIKELGFGSKSFSNTERLINQDGSFNVTKKGFGLAGFSLYHALINMHWTTFFIMIVLAYFLLNFFFAIIYFLIGPQFLTEGPLNTSWEAFWHCFYFSSQTLTTVGFGRISPTGHFTSLIAALEAMFGLLCFALGTGILYGRFSKAKAKILFSKNALISPYRGIKGFKFRIVNSRKNQLIELEARVMYSFLQKDGIETKRRYSQLHLELNFINMFPLPWTIVHPIDESSPLKGKGILDLSGEDAEFIVIVKGYDDTFNQYVHQVYSYKYYEVVFDADFQPMFDSAATGRPVVYLNKINDHQKVM